jgi:hypothetical protein
MELAPGDLEPTLPTKYQDKILTEGMVESRLRCSRATGRQTVGAFHARSIDPQGEN